MKQISSIRGLEYIADYYYITTCGKIISYRNKNILILKQSNSRKYKRITFMTKQKKEKCFSVHRLVALAFIPNLENKPQVNHINENTKDNFVINLNWMTAKENMNHGTRINKVSGINHFSTKSKEYYKNNSVYRKAFKATCKKNNWKVSDFLEIFAEWKISPSGQKTKKYFYAAGQQ